MVKVLVRDNNVEQALRVAKRKSQKEGLYREMKERQRYEKPTTKRKRLKKKPYATKRNVNQNNVWYSDSKIKSPVLGIFFVLNLCLQNTT